MNIKFNKNYLESCSINLQEYANESQIKGMPNLLDSIVKV